MDYKQLFEMASSEIKALRSQNQAMASRLEVFDKMMLLFTSAPAYPGYGMTSPDVVCELDRAIDRIKKDGAKERAVERQEKD
jgi:hypothetical protein